MRLFELTGKVAIVTGSTKGIGRGIAECLASAGAQVIASSRSQADCDRVAVELAMQYPSSSSYGVRCDISAAASVDALVAAVVERSGGIDVLVCNAARCRGWRRLATRPTTSSLRNSIRMSSRRCDCACARPTRCSVAAAAASC